VLVLPHISPSYASVSFLALGLTLEALSKLVKPSVMEITREKESDAAEASRRW
jgi:hypothetical protein